MKRIPKVGEVVLVESPIGSKIFLPAVVVRAEAYRKGATLRRKPLGGTLQYLVARVFATGTDFVRLAQYVRNLKP